MAASAILKSCIDSDGPGRIEDLPGRFSPCVAASARSRRGRLLAVAAGIVSAWACAAVTLAERSVRLPAALCNQPAPALAARVAREAGARWQAAEIQAADGVPLRGWLFVPERGTGRAVILLHGIGDTRQGELGHAPYLLAEGYAVLVPDGRAHGASGGGLVTYGLRERDDVRCWADWLLATQPVGALYGMGHSLGAAILLQTLADGPRFRAVVAESPFAEFPGIAYDRLGSFTGVPPSSRFVFAPLVEPSLWYARWRYGIDLIQASPASAVAQTRVPVLLIHGTKDWHVEIHHSRKLRAANPHFVTLWEIEGGQHVRLIVQAGKDYEQRVTAWFAAHR
jgi:pimeloyl-ACP methyl ester carboxylesterase